MALLIMRVLISKHFYSESSKEVDDADEEEMLVEKRNNQNIEEEPEEEGESDMNLLQQANADLKPGADEKVKAKADKKIKNLIVDEKGDRGKKSSPGCP